MACEGMLQKAKVSLLTDLMHDDVTCPTGSVVVVVTLKSKMTASSASSWANSKSTWYLAYLRAQINHPSRYSTAQLHQNTSAFLPVKISRFGEIRRHIGFVRDCNYHNARSSRKSFVLRQYARVRSIGSQQTKLQHCCIILVV